MLVETAQAKIIADLNKDLEKFIICFKKHANEIKAIIQAVIRSHDHIDPMERSKEPLLSFKRLIFPFRQLEDKYHEGFPIYSSVKQMLFEQFVETNNELNSELWDLCFEAVMTGNVHFTYGDLSEVERGEAYHEVYTFITGNLQIFDYVHFYSQILLENLLLNPYDNIPKMLDCHILSEKDLPVREVVRAKSACEIHANDRAHFCEIVTSGFNRWQEIGFYSLDYQNNYLQMIVGLVDWLGRKALLKESRKSYLYEKYLEAIVKRTEDLRADFDQLIIHEIYQLIIMSRANVNFLIASNCSDKLGGYYLLKMSEIIERMESQYYLEMLDVGIDPPAIQEVMLIEYPEHESPDVMEYVTLHPDVPANKIPTHPNPEVLVGKLSYWQQQQSHCREAIRLLRLQASCYGQDSDQHVDVVFGHYADGMLINEKLAFLEFIDNRLSELCHIARVQENELKRHDMEKVYVHVNYYNDMIASYHHHFFENKDFWLTSLSFELVLDLCQSIEGELVHAKNDDNTISFYRHITQIISDITRLQQIADRLWEDELRFNDASTHKQVTNAAALDLFSECSAQVKVYLNSLPGSPFGRDISIYAASDHLVGCSSFWMLQVEYCKTAIKILEQYAGDHYSVHATYVDGIRIKEKIDYLVHLLEKLRLIVKRANEQDALLLNQSELGMDFCQNLIKIYEVQLADSCHNPYNYQGTTLHWELLFRQCDRAVDEFKNNTMPGDESEHFKQLRHIRSMIAELKTESECKVNIPDESAGDAKSIWFTDVSEIDFVGWYRDKLSGSLSQGFTRGGKNTITRHNYHR